MSNSNEPNNEPNNEHEVDPRQLWLPEVTPPKTNNNEPPKAEQAQQVDSEYVSPTVLALRTSGLLKATDSWNPQTTCEHCKAAVWTASETDLRAYCKVMHVISWSKNEQNNLMSCDAQEL
jgi:hypothetical protein